VVLLHHSAGGHLTTRHAQRPPLHESWSTYYRCLRESPYATSSNLDMAQQSPQRVAAPAVANWSGWFAHAQCADERQRGWIHLARKQPATSRFTRVCHCRLRRRQQFPGATFTVNYGGPFRRRAISFKMPASPARRRLPTTKTTQVYGFVSPARPATAIHGQRRIRQSADGIMHSSPAGGRRRSLCRTTLTEHGSSEAVISEMSDTGAWFTASLRQAVI